MMLVLGLLGLITSLFLPRLASVHSLILTAASLRLHGPEDEKYSLKGALTRVEAGDGWRWLETLKLSFLSFTQFELEPSC